MAPIPNVISPTDMLVLLAGWRDAFVQWLTLPNTVLVLTIWFVVFWMIILVPMAHGFGPGGVVACSLAAAFQSWMYSVFTPAGGFFAVLASIGMMGFKFPPLVLQAVILATLATVLVGWARGIDIVHGIA
ncbi:hypothetical protein DL96DRAFT_1054295 [Flagelloscypha sp. PMI_526]|nr:hypothetical protein DL96DRAFT_1054295 [Flagelloscypha sp. PMI_526]